MVGTVYKVPFVLRCNINASGNVAAINRFRVSHGPNMLTTFLHEAGIDSGEWTFRIQEPFRVSSRTPPIQVRKAEVNGVSLWLKPGDNGSGVKGVLLVTKDKNKTPEDVYKILDAKLKKEHIQTAESRSVDHIEIDLDDPTMVRLIEAVDELVSNGVTSSINSFAERIARKMTDNDADADVPHWLEALEHAVALGMLKDEKTYYSVTTKGLELVCMFDETEEDEAEEDEYEALEKEIAPVAANNGNGHASTMPALPRISALPFVPSKAAPAVATMTQPTPPAAPKDDSVSDPIAVLIANQAKFADMAKVVGALSANRASQAKALKAIDDLRAELVKLKAAEAEVSKGLDLNAMAAFFQKG